MNRVVVSFHDARHGNDGNAAIFVSERACSIASPTGP